MFSFKENDVKWLCEIYQYDGEALAQALFTGSGDEKV